MSYYMMDNENNAYFNEDLTEFPYISYGNDAQDGQPCGLVVDTDIKNKKIRVENSESNTLIAASTGSGKTRRLITMYLISCILSGHSVIVHDPKGELYKFSEPTLNKRGYKAIVLDFRDTSKGDRYNIFQDPAWEYQFGNKDRAIERFMAIINTIMSKYHSNEDPFWEFSAGSYFLVLVLLACEIYDYKDVTIENIFKLHIQSNESNGYGGPWLNKYFGKDKDNMLYRLASLTMEAPNETKRSIFSVFVQAISEFVLNDALCDMTYNSTFDIKDIIEEKTAVFLITRDETTVHSALVTAMVDQFYATLIDEAHENYNGRLPRRVEFILDEFANMGKVKIEKMVSAARSRNMRFLICIQSVRQLNCVYGSDVAKVILDNCDNTVYLHSSDMDTLKLISERCGEKYISDVYKRPLVSVEKLQYLKKGEALMLLNRVRPFFVTLPDISEYGIVFAESIDLEARERQERQSLDFKMVAYQKANDDLVYAKSQKEKNSKPSDEAKSESSDTSDKNSYSKLKTKIKTAVKPANMNEKLKDENGIMKDIDDNKREWLE